MITTTLTRIRLRFSNPYLFTGAKPASFPKKGPIPLTSLLDTWSFADAIFAWGAEPQYEREQLQFAVFCAKHGLDELIDIRSQIAILVAERFVNNDATLNELEEASRAAKDVLLQPIPQKDARLAAMAARACTLPATAAVFGTYLAVAYYCREKYIPDCRAALKAEFIRICNETEERER